MLYIADVATNAKMIGFKIISILLLSSILVNAQVNKSVIKNIRKEYQHIRSSLDTYDTTMIDIVGESAEGGQATAFHNDDEIKLIEVVWLGETGKREVAYYFDQGGLFFAFSTDYHYNRPIYWNDKIAKENGDTETFDPSKTKAIENRYYFDNGKLIRWLDNQKNEVDADSIAYFDKGEELITHANRMKEQLME